MFLCKPKKKKVTHVILKVHCKCSVLERKEWLPAVNKALDFTHLDSVQVPPCMPCHGPTDLCLDLDFYRSCIF